MRRVSGVGVGGLGFRVYWVVDCGWLASWWKEEGRGREMFDRTKYLASTVPSNGVLGAPLLKPKACLFIF